MERTLGEAHAAVMKWLNEPLQDESIVDDAINDAIEQLWEAIMTVNISLALAGPVTIDLAAATEREDVVTIADPTTNPVLDQVAGGALAGQTVYGAYSLVTASGSETRLSPVVDLAINANYLPTMAAPANTPPALGWNCYMGSTAALLAKQNPAPIDFAFTFQAPPTGIVSAPDAPPPPVSNTTGDNIFYIRHMEIALPEPAGTTPTYKHYDQADIDSTLMASMARRQATSWPYQSYAWDFVNQSRIEIRPALGTALSPRFFYIQKPYRLAYPNSPIPFNGITHVRYIRYKAVALVLLSLHEYEAAQAWEQQGATALGSIRSAISQTNWSKDVRVRPYLRRGC